jgi:hypothetical protein
MKREQTLHNLDRVLAAEEELVPSSGFAAAVMARVRQESVMPEPIAFPWKRVLPAAIVVAIGFAWCVGQLMRMGIATAAVPMLIRLQPALFVNPRVESVVWAAAALALSAVPWLIARRLVRHRGLV